MLKKLGDSGSILTPNYNTDVVCWVVLPKYCYPGVK